MNTLLRVKYFRKGYTLLWVTPVLTLDLDDLMSFSIFCPSRQEFRDHLKSSLTLSDLPPPLRPRSVRPRLLGVDQSRELRG